MENLWPQLGTKEEITPREILSFQANTLTESTNGLLQGQLSIQQVQPAEQDIDEFNKTCFLFTLRIYAPRINYSLTVVRVVHEIIKVYPFQAYSYLTEEKFKGNSPKDLEDVLSKIFKNPTLKEYLDTLIIQSRKQ